jgi:branched-chain amino acid transport system substrate-binding protein
LGVKTVAVETITAATTDMQAQLTAIKDANPDLLVVNVDTGQVPSVLVQLGESGITAQYLGDTSLGSAVVTGNPAAIKAAQCGLFTTPWVPTSTAGGNPLFVSQWKAANNGQTPDFFDALGRDAMWAMATAIKNANSVNPSQIRDALSQISGFSGALGLYGWNNPAAPGQPTYGGVNEQVQNGQDVPWTSSTTCTK